MQSACGNGRGLASAPQANFNFKCNIPARSRNIYCDDTAKRCRGRDGKGKRHKKTRENIMRDSRTSLTIDRHKRCSMILRPCHFIVVLGHFLFEEKQFVYRFSRGKTRNSHTFLCNYCFPQYTQN